VVILMDDFEFANRAAVILHDLSLERKGLRQLLNRWYVSDEPLRHDAANLLRERGWVKLIPEGFQRVGDDTNDLS
jgi:hypothetical protein